MMDKSQCIPLDQIAIVPSIGFTLVNDYDDKIIFNASITISGDIYKDKVPVRNPSGHFIFFKLIPDTYSFHVEADNFNPLDITLSVTENPDTPVEVRMVPSPSYEFPTGATVIRGEIFNESDKSPIPGVTIGLNYIGKSISTISSDRGEFVLYMSKMSNTTTIEINNTKYVKSASKTNGLKLTFNSEKPDFKKSKTINWEIGKETHIKLSI
jgi:hypothetical protein